MPSPSPWPHGVWQMLRAELAGETAPELVARRTVIELSPDRYLVRFDGQPVDRGTCAIDDTAAPKTMTLCGESGPNAGRTIPCLYQLVGDRLRICYGLDGTPPTDFSTAVGQPRYLATYRRHQP